MEYRCWNGPRAPSQYPKRRFSVRSRKVSKPRDLYLELSDCSEIWQALRQQCCRCACQISKWYNYLKFQSRVFETLRDLTKRRLFGYWDGAQGPYLIITIIFAGSGYTMVWQSHNVSLRHMHVSFILVRTGMKWKIISQRYSALSIYHGHLFLHVPKNISHSSPVSYASYVLQMWVICPVCHFTYRSMCTCNISMLHRKT